MRSGCDPDLWTHSMEDLDQALEAYEKIGSEMSII